MHNEETPPQVKLQAASILMDRGLGKAAQAVTIDHQVQITTIERRIIDSQPIIDVTPEQPAALRIADETD